MYYNIISINNYQDLETLRERGEKRAKENYGKDPFNGYTTEVFAIFGTDAIERFGAEHGFQFKNYAPQFKTDGKTSAKIIPYITGEWYYDARDGGHGGLADVYSHSEIRYLVEYGGVLLTPGFHRKPNEPAEFFLFNDQAIYHEYLYNYEKYNPKPQRVGVLSDRKLEQWKGWLIERHKCYEETVRALDTKSQLFLNAVKSVDSSKCSEYEVGGASGHIVRNGLKFSYQISNKKTVSVKLEVSLDVRLRCKTDVEMLEAWGRMVEGKY